MSAIEAGRELDALVAEKVMGWKPSMFSNYPWQLVPPDGDGSAVRQVPNYSTDIAAAWLVVERMCEFPSYVSLGFGKWLQFRVDIATGAGREVMNSRAFAKTAPLAICNAALAAVGAA